MIPDSDVFLGAAREIADERGDFALFALVLRDEMEVGTSTVVADPASPAGWDVLVSAPWIAADRRAPLEYVAKKIAKQHGGKTALKSIARLGAVPMSHPMIRRILDAIGGPKPLEAPANVRSVGGASLIEGRHIGPGISQALIVTVTKNPKAKLAKAR